MKSKGRSTKISSTRVVYKKGEWYLKTGTGSKLRKEPQIGPKRILCG